MLDHRGSALRRRRQSPAPAPCAAPAHHQFDFWIGSWSVTEQGKPAGNNRIERLLGGCALLESWVGIGGSRGHSLNFYDPRRGVWQQTWVDTPWALNLTGQFGDGRMVLTASAPMQKHMPHDSIASPGHRIRTAACGSCGTSRTTRPDLEGRLRRAVHPQIA